MHFKRPNELDLLTFPLVNVSIFPVSIDIDSPLSSIQNFIQTLMNTVTVLKFHTNP